MDSLNLVYPVDLRKYAEHKWARPCVRGKCAMAGCESAKAIYGCSSCGVRLCSMECMCAHQSGRVPHKSVRVKVEWEPWWDAARSEWVDINPE